MGCFFLGETHLVPKPHRKEKGWSYWTIIFLVNVLYYKHFTLNNKQFSIVGFCILMVAYWVFLKLHSCTFMFSLFKLFTVDVHLHPFKLIIVFLRMERSSDELAIFEKLLAAYGTIKNGRSIDIPFGLTWMKHMGWPESNLFHSSESCTEYNRFKNKGSKKKLI